MANEIGHSSPSSMHRHGNGSAVRTRCATSPRCAALGRQAASFKGAPLTRLKGVQGRSIPPAPLFLPSSLCQISSHVDNRVTDCATNIELARGSLVEYTEYFVRLKSSRTSFCHVQISLIIVQGDSYRTGLMNLLIFPQFLPAVVDNCNILIFGPRINLGSH